MLLHSLYCIDVIRDTSQVPMAPWVELASQFAPVPDSQGLLFVEPQNEWSEPALLKLPPHAPTHPNTAVCSALRYAGAKTQAAVVPDVSLENPAGQDAAQSEAPGAENVPGAHVLLQTSVEVCPVPLAEYLPAEQALQSAVLTTLASS